jgi:1,2-phenylacetyl-CoA epoxidase PaaB subunit
MQEHDHVRHVLVTTAEGQLVGSLSTADAEHALHLAHQVHHRHWLVQADV